MRYASFFTGAGGLDLGLDQAGWECVFANEMDPQACETLRLNGRDGVLRRGDIRGLAVEEIRRAAGPGPLAVVGGPPCQAFSTAGRRLGLNDERGNVFLKFLDLAISLDPELIVIENVRGLLSAPLRHRPLSQRGSDWPPLAPDETRGGALRHILAVLGTAGFDVTFDLYDAANFGVPQRRERIVLFASRAGKPPRLAPSHGPEGWRTFREAASGLAECDYVPLRPAQSRYLPWLGPGQNWRDLPRQVQREAMGKAFESGGGRTGFYRRLAWDEPAPTLMTSPTMPATLLAHPEELRPLSVQEYARLQTFPDGYRFAGRLQERYRLIGNAVPVEFGRAIAEQIGGACSKTGAASVRPSRYHSTSDSTWLMGSTPGLGRR
ncbi:MAG: DNA cytosine methyltransferase [Fimbriimonadaceae bacterium]|nr:DNA cytosine methyltransferase [Fimbriimonadaceae bacterium]QYK58498.1 MAG: DNA cytosine methyltransferase [Fimbriimonadaceae bacterium]